MQNSQSINQNYMLVISFFYFHPMINYNPISISMKSCQRSQSNWPIGDKPTESRDTEQYSGYWEGKRFWMWKKGYLKYKGLWMTKIWAQSDDNNSHGPLGQVSLKSIKYTYLVLPWSKIQQQGAEEVV